MSKHLNIAWDAEPGATGYQVEYALEGLAWQRVYDGTALSVSVLVSQDGLYRVRVRAYQGSSVGPWATATQTVSGATTALSASLAPTSLSLTAADTDQVSEPVAVTTVGGVRPYRYQWLLQSGSARVVVRAPTASTTAFSVAGLSAGETVSAVYKCQVSDAAGTVLLTSNAVTVSFTQATAAVQDVAGFALSDNGDGSATLSWDAITDPNVVSLEIRHSPAVSGATWAGATFLAATDSSATEILVALAQGTYLIKALGVLGESVTAAVAVFSGDLSDGLPIGSTFAWSHATPPSAGRNLLLDGSTYDVDDYPVLGALYGGSPGGTFAVHDWRHVPLSGYLGSGSLGAVVGDNLLNLKHKHDPGTLEAAAHTHGAGSLAAAAHTHGAGSLVAAAHAHGANVTTVTQLQQQLIGGQTVNSLNSINSDGPHAVSGSTASDGPHAVSGSTASDGPHAVSGQSDEAIYEDGSLTPDAIDRRAQRALVAWYQRAR